MPKTLFPSNTFPTEIPNFPIAGAGEPIAIGPLEAAIQAVLNRTEHLHNSRLALEGEGTKRIRHVASLADLENLAGASDGDTVDVQGFGRYRLHANSPLAADGLWILNSVSGGKWIHLLNNIKANGAGLATLNSGGLLLQDLRPNAVETVNIMDGAITSAKLAPYAVGTLNIADGAITSSKLGLSDSNGNQRIGLFSLHEGDWTTYAANLRWDGSSWRYVTENAGAGFAAFGNNKLIFAVVPYGVPGEIAPLTIPMELNNEGAIFNKPISTKQPASLAMQYHWNIYRDNSLAWQWAVSGNSNTHSLQLIYYDESGTGYVHSIFNNLNEYVPMGNIYPLYDNYKSLGKSYSRWAVVYSAGGLVQTSDEREKTDIQDEPLGLEFINSLRPVAYRWKIGGYEEGEPIIEKHDAPGGDKHRLSSPNLVPRPGRRLHHGLIAQEVKAVLDKYGVDFGGWILDDVNDPNSRQSLRYDQFIAPIIKAVQELSSRVAALEQRGRGRNNG